MNIYISKSRTDQLDYLVFEISDKDKLGNLEYKHMILLSINEFGSCMEFSDYRKYYTSHPLFSDRYIIKV